MMMDCAASRKRWTRRAARSFAVLIDRSTARCFQAVSSLGLVTDGSVDCREGRTCLDCTGERRVIGVLAPSRDDVSEIVTFPAREYYSLTALHGSRTRITGGEGWPHAIDLRCRRRGVPR